MKQIKIAKKMIVIVLLYFIIYNSYFGWNWEPINNAEKVCDYICNIAIWVSIIFYLTPLQAMYETTIQAIEGDEIEITFEKNNDAASPK